MTILWQGAKAWRSALIGEGPGRVGRFGCVVASFANLLRFLHLDDDANPLTVMANARVWAAEQTEKTGKPVRAFLRDLVVWDVVGAGNGLVVSDVVDDRNGDGLMRKAIRDALEAGHAAFLWVDKDDALPDHDDRGKHWVVAVGLLKGDTADTDEVTYLDSATVDEGTLNLCTLMGQSSWNGVTKIYRVRAVRAVRPG